MTSAPRLGFLALPCSRCMANQNPRVIRNDQPLQSFSELESGRSRSGGLVARAAGFALLDMRNLAVRAQAILGMRAPVDAAARILQIEWLARINEHFLATKAMTVCLLNLGKIHLICHYAPP